MNRYHELIVPLFAMVAVHGTLGVIGLAYSTARRFRGWPKIPLSRTFIVWCICVAVGGLMLADLALHPRP